MSVQRKAKYHALLAAGLYALSAPLSKLLLGEMMPRMMAALLYLGAGLGMACVALFGKSTGVASREQPLAKSDWPYIAAMIALDVLAPILLLMGLNMTTAANISLLNNFEIVATSVIALLLFKESITGRLWMAIAVITAACMILSVEDAGSFSFSIGSLYALLACLCWGLENNCTRKLSLKNPLQIVVIKGIGSGAGAFGIAALLQETAVALWPVAAALLLGFVAYGLSIYFYVRAQRELGALRTSAYYAVAPFVSSALSLVIFRDALTLSFFIGLGLMVLGVRLVTAEQKG